MGEAVLRALGSLFLWVGLFVGYGLGVVVTKFQAARNSYRGAQKSLPGFRKLYWSMLFRSSGAWVVVAVLIILSLLWMGAFDEGNGSSKPASVPTVSPKAPTVSPHK